MVDVRSVLIRNPVRAVLVDDETLSVDRHAVVVGRRDGQSGPEEGGGPDGQRVESGRGRAEEVGVEEGLLVLEE